MYILCICIVLKVISQTQLQVAGTKQTELNRKISQLEEDLKDAHESAVRAQKALEVATIIVSTVSYVTGDIYSPIYLNSAQKSHN